LSHAYFSPLNSTTRAAIDAQFDALTEDLPILDGATIRLWGRDLTVPRSAGSVAQFAFTELCGRPLGAADYLELTQRYGTLFVTDVPRMGLGEKDKVCPLTRGRGAVPLPMICVFVTGAAIYHFHRCVL